MLMEIQERFFVTITVSISGSSAMELSLMYSASGKQEDAALINRIEFKFMFDYACKSIYAMEERYYKGTV